MFLEQQPLHYVSQRASMRVQCGMDLVKMVDTSLNDTCRLITGCLKATPVPKIQNLAGIAPPQVHRAVARNSQRKKQQHD